MLQIENAMAKPNGYGIRDPQQNEPRTFDLCAYGCGQTIDEGYEHIEWDGEWFYDTPCFLKYHGAEWREVI